MKTKEKNNSRIKYFYINKKCNNIECNQNENKNSRIIPKFMISLLFTLIIIYFITVSLNNKNNQLKTLLSNKSINKEQNEKHFIENLKTVLYDDEIFINEKMNKYTTFQLGGPAKYFIKTKSIN